MKPHLICLTALVILSACGRNDNPAENRASRAAKATGNIVVGAAAPWETLGLNLWEGMELAAERIHRKGGILGRKLQLVKRDDLGSVNQGTVVAKRFAEDPEMVAVIGHFNSYISVPTSILYEYYGLLMISPTSTSAKLTGNGLRRVFRMVPNDVTFADALADFCLTKKYRTMVIYHESLDLFEGQANAFDDAADERGITVTDRLSYEAISGLRNFKKDLQYWKDTFVFDAIFLAGTLPHAALFISEARKLGIHVPIVSGDSIDSPELLNLVPAEEDDIFIASIFRPGDAREEVRSFVEAYFGKYQASPDTAAALGYDTVNTLAAAMENAGTTVPDRVAEALRRPEGGPGVTGTRIFDEKGDVKGPSIWIKRVKKGQFEYLPH